MSAPLPALVLALALAGCATSPASLDGDPLSERPGELSRTWRSWRGSAAPEPGPSDLAVLARLDEAFGDVDAAADRWLRVAERSATLRPWAVMHLLELVDRVPLSGAMLTRVRGIPELAELTEALALRLDDEEALCEARVQLGTGFGYRRSRRLLRYPGTATSAPLGAAGLEAPLESRAGFIASPEEGPGLYAFRLELPPGRHHIEVRTEHALRAFVGDLKVYEHDALAELLPERLAFDVVLSAGQAVELHLVSRTSIASARVFVRPPLAPAAPAEIPDKVARLARAELAFADRDVARAAADDLSARSPLVMLARARLALVDPSRAPELARSAAKQDLATALILEPTLVEARVLLSRLHAEDQELDDAARIIGAGELPDLASQVLVYTDPMLAARHARDTLAHLPDSCSARQEWLDSAWETLLLRPEDVKNAFGGALVPLPGPCLEARLRAVQLLAETSRLDDAERLLAPLVAPLDALGAGLDPGAERARALTLAARIALARGRWSDAASAAREALATGGADAFARELLGRAERLMGGPAAPRVDPAADLGLPLMDARALIEAHRRRGPAADGREILLDDRWVRVYADGSQRVRVHRILRVNDVAAVEAVGELPVPDDAEILVVRTWKLKRGSLVALEPEDILEKSTVSLPALSPGDYAEWSWFYPVAADPRIAPGWRTRDHAFDSDEGPVTVARFSLSLAPGASAPTFVVDPRLPPPTRPDERTWVFGARGLERVYDEPLDPRPELRRMTLHASSGAQREQLADAWAAELALSTRPSPTIEALYAEAIARVPEVAGPDRLLEALYDAVRAEVDEPDDASPFGVPAAWVAERRRGSRALLLTALCRQAGLSCELVLARPLWEGPETSASDADALTYPLVRHVRPGQVARWLDPTSRWMPIGLLPPALEGVFGVSLAPRPPRVSPVETPTATGPGVDPAHWGARDIALRIEVTTDGANATCTGRETLDGVFAASWRGALVPLGVEARDRILGAIVQQALPGASIEAVAIEHLEDDRAPLVWTWRARIATQAAGGAAPSARGPRTVQLAMFPEALTNDTVVLPNREAPLLVNRAARMHLVIEAIAPPGWVFVRAPSDLSFSYDLGRFERVSSFQDLGARVVVEKRFLLRPGLVEPARYAAWSEAAVAIDRGDIIQVMLAPTRPPMSPP